MSIHFSQRINFRITNENFFFIFLIFHIPQTPKHVKLHRLVMFAYVIIMSTFMNEELSDYDSGSATTKGLVFINIAYFSKNTI